MKTTLLKSGFALAIFAFAPAADCDGGARNLDDGECPTGEVCASGTPTGLEFVAPVIDEGFFDEGEVKIMALGGTQTIQLDTDDEGSGNLTPFTLPYDASFDSTSLSVASTSGNTVIARAGTVESSSTSLRITRPSDGALYDRIVIETRALASAALAPTLAELESGDGAASGSGSGALPMLFAPGGTGYVKLLASDNIELVDDSVMISGLGVIQRSWDKFTVGNVAAGAHDVTLASAGHDFTLGYAVAAAPDRVGVVGGSGQLEPGGNLVCFAAFLGTRFMHVPWTFAADNATLAPTAFDGCETITPTSLGHVTVHVHAGTFAADVSFDAIAAQVAHRHPSAIAGSLGDRAAVMQ